MNKQLISDVLFITAAAPQSGKTTAMSYVSRMTGLKGISTSDIVIEEYINSLGQTRLTLESIKFDRSKDPNKHRDALIKTGIEMNQRGLYPSTIAYQRGYQIIEGARQSEEIMDAVYTCHKNGNTCRHLFIDTARTKDKDSTNAQALSRCANIIITNTGTFDQFYKFLDQYLFK